MLDFLSGPIDRLLDRITSYRLVLYVLLTYVGVAVAFSALGILPFHWYDLVLLAGWIAIVCRVSNVALAKVFNIPRNKDSDLITALILTLIATPILSPSTLIGVSLAAVVAMASKYLLAPRRKHIFNPAALGVLAAGLLLHQSASWWVGTFSMAPVLVIGGLLVLRKMKRVGMATIFASVYIVIIAAAELATRGSGGLSQLLWLSLVGSSFIFFATVMFPEPQTSPLAWRRELGYAGVVAILYATAQVHLFGLNLAPEAALLIGNLFSYLISNNPRLVLKFAGKHTEAEGIYSFKFTGPKPKFQAGQYMEWTLPTANSDNRGNRRYFTIASSPTEPDLMVTVRLPEQKISSFKQQLSGMKSGASMLASDLSGSFVLPVDTDQKLAFLAGGIGVTPFRSMVKFSLDTDQSRPMTLLYFGQNPTDFAFREVFDEAKRVGLKTIYETKRIDQDIIKNEIPDFAERLFYLSGPPVFVRSARQILLGLGVKRRQIHEDFFPGYES